MAFFWAVIRRLSVWALIFVLYSIPRVSLILHYRQLANEGTHTRGLVVSRIEKLQFTYSYFVNGHQYSGTARAGLAGVPPFGDLTPGQPLDVIYLTSKPSESSANEPTFMMQHEKETAVEQAIPVGLFSGVVLGLIGIIIRLTKGSRYRGMPKAVLLRWL